MSADHAVKTPEAVEPAPGLATRAFSLALLVAIVGGLGWLAYQIVGVFLHAWVAPLHLGPDNDQVAALNLQLARQIADVERIEAEVQRIDHELAGIDEGVARLETLRAQSNDVFEWGADVQARQAATVRQGLRALERRRQLLLRQREQSRGEVTDARRQLEAGLIGRRELAIAEQDLARVELSLADNERALAASRLELSQAELHASTFEASLADRPLGVAARGRMPEVVARQEQAARIEIEIVQLQAQRRGLVALRDVAARNLARMQEALDQMRARPLYRATRTEMDVAFVPYEQLDGVSVGDEVARCTLWIFACRTVGHVSELVPGEVVTQDPWGELARGRYAVLRLDDARAVEERVLRVR